MKNYLVFWSQYIDVITIIPPNTVINEGTSPNTKKVNSNPKTGNSE